jgi:uncharacterized protein
MPSRFGSTTRPGRAERVSVARQTIFVTGATGLVGSRLCQRLTAGGHRVLAHRRDPGAEAASGPGLTWFSGDLLRQGEWQDALADADAVVHLAGASVARARWTRARKNELRASRIASTQQIVSALARAARPAAVFLCASASGYYGARGEERLDEGSTAGDDFLAGLCVEWEAAALGAREAGVRVACLRFGAILSPRGGALAAMLPAFRLGLGGPLGSADRYFPWLHEDDAVGLIEWALRPGGSAQGAINAVAPDAVRMGEWAACLGRVLGRPARLPLPSAVLRLVLGERGPALVPGQFIVPRAALEMGYGFRHPRLETALTDLLR